MQIIMAPAWGTSSEHLINVAIIITIIVVIEVWLATFPHRTTLRVKSDEIQTVDLKKDV